MIEPPGMSCATDTTVATPGGKWTGKEFEAALLKAAETGESRGDLCMGRYGVQASMVGGRTMAVQSLPDFEGVTSMGVQFICEAKVTERDLLRTHTTFIKKRQVTHMVRRADFCVPCFFMVLHRERILKTHTVQPVTMVYPVHRSLPWIQECMAAYKAKREPEGSIPREFGFEIEWFIPSRKGATPRPDLITAIEKTRNLILGWNQPR